MKLLKILVTAVAAAAAAAALSLGAMAVEADDDNRERENFHRSGIWAYTLLDDNTAAVSKYYGKSAHPVIPDEIDGYTVSAISGGWYFGDDGKPVLYGNIHGISYTDDGLIADSQVYSPFSENTDIETISVPDSVEWIGAIAFRNCTSLKTISISGNLRFIGNNCFDGCTSLESIVIPESVEYIDQEAFKNCKSLRSVSIQNTHLEHSVFENCSALESFTLPAGMTEVPPLTFSGCTSLGSVNFPDGMTTIGDSAFKDCTSLGSISLPDSLCEIYNSAFSGCTSLESAELNNITTLGSKAFADCGLKSLYLSDALSLIGANAFGTTESGAHIEGFVLTCPEFSAARSYAEENGIAYEIVQDEDIGDGNIEIRSPIDPDLLFKIVVGIIITAAVSVFIAIVLMIKNQKTAEIDEADEYLDYDETSDQPEEQETDEDQSEDESFDDDNE